MNIIISILNSSKTKVSPNEKEIVKKKLSRLEKYFNENVEVKTTISTRKNDTIVEVMIPMKKTLIRAEAENEDLYSAVDMVVSRLSRQLRKYKTKLNNKGHETIRFENIETYEHEEDPELKIVRRKKFPMHPMTEEEAILQMELIGHDFFVFNNADSGEINVLYKRYDDKYGIIVPE